MGTIMGKGPKHNNGKSRNNGIFKVAGHSFKNEKKGKPKEVTSKLKLISRKNNEKVSSLDDTMKELMEASVKSGKCFSGEDKKPKQIISKSKPAKVEEHEMEDLAESFLKH